MIRNVCIHISNEQPLLADLYAIPTSADAGLTCTNVRTMDGKRPVFVDQSASVFFFPYHVIRFLEIPDGAIGAHEEEGGLPAPAAAPAPRTVSPDRSSAAVAARMQVVAVVPTGDAADGELDLDSELDLEIDEGFLKRVRDL